MTSKTLLAIETSCDETSIAVLRCRKTAVTTEFETLSHITLSQAQMHAEYGGVFPTMARRDHQANITSLIAECLNKSGLLRTTSDPKTDISLQYLEREEPVLLSLTDFVSQHERPAIDAIAVTTGPGLEPTLWVGVSTAKALADYWNIPLIPVNHMEGHILSVIVQDDIFSIPPVPFPALALLISGGHTEFVKIESIGQYTKIGQTRDDAIGEAFDKVARLLDLPYPGGPQIERLANEHQQYLLGLSIPGKVEIEDGIQEGLVKDPKNPLPVSPLPSGRSTEIEIKLPRPMMYTGDLDFSFSGIKTAVRYLVESLPKPLSEEVKQAIAYEFQCAVTDVLVHKTKKAVQEYGFQSLIVGGGVAASQHICAKLSELCDSLGITAYIPERMMAMDNALMIGIVGATKLLNPEYIPPALETVEAYGNWQYKHSGVFE